MQPGKGRGKGAGRGRGRWTPVRNFETSDEEWLEAEEWYTDDAEDLHGRPEELRDGGYEAPPQP